MSQLVMCENVSEMGFGSGHRAMSNSAMTTRSSTSSQPQTHISSPTPMLPDDHWNDIEIISFGLHDTHLVHQQAVQADPNSSIVHYAASNNYIELLKKLIITDKAEIDLLDQEGNTPLLLAASFGNTEIVKFLLENGANINTQNTFDNSALHEASWRGYSQTLQILCRYKAKLHLKNKQGHTALHLSAQKGHNQCCRILLLSGCKPNIKNNFGDTPLHSASRYGHVGVVRILISAFANVNELNKNDDTSLHIAAAMGRKKLAKILLESGCNPTIVNKQGETPMNIALRKSFLEIQELIASPPPLKPVYLKQQELYDRPLQGSYKDIYCAVPKSSENLYYSGGGQNGDHDTFAPDEEELYYGKGGRRHHSTEHKSRHSNRRSRGCKSDFSNGYLASASGVLQRSNEKQTSSVSKYYASMLRKLGGTSPLDQDELLAGNQDSFEERTASPVKAPHLQPPPQTRRNREFPKPKLETLPSEPLEKGEQYFVDLSGHIHKGRIPPGPDMEPLISNGHHATKSRPKK